MRTLKKALSLLLVGIMAVTSLVCGGVTAGAYFDNDKIYVDGFYNTENNYCIRVGNFGISEYMNTLYASYKENPSKINEMFFNMWLKFDAAYEVCVHVTLDKGSDDVAFNFVPYVKKGTSSDYNYYADEIVSALPYTNSETDEGIVMFLPEKSPQIKKLSTYKSVSVYSELQLVWEKRIMTSQKDVGYVSVKPDFKDLDKGQSSNNSSENTSSSKTVSIQPKIFREVTSDSVKLYLDGVNADYFADFRKRFSLKESDIKWYYISFSLGDILDDTYYDITFFVPGSNIKNVDVDEDTLEKNTDDNDMIGCSGVEISYYTKNSGNLTSGYCITITNKNELETIKEKSVVDSVYISVTTFSGNDKDCNDFWSSRKIDLNIKDLSASTSSASKEISSLSVDKIQDMKYTGKSLKPAVTVKDGTKTLVKGTDYTLSYKNNKNIGTATVTITGKGSYTGTKAITFRIVPAATTLTAKKSGSKYALSWKKVSGITKYQIQYSTDSGKTFKSAGTVAASKTSTTLKLDTSKTYTFRIRSYKTVDGKKYYSSWSKAVTVK